MITYEGKLGELEVTIVIPDSGKCSFTVMAPTGKKGESQGPHERVDLSDLRRFFQTVAKLLS